jgi:hypothetical protein
LVSVGRIALALMLPADLAVMSVVGRRRLVVVAERESKGFLVVADFSVLELLVLLTTLL